MVRRLSVAMLGASAVLAGHSNSKLSRMQHEHVARSVNMQGAPVIADMFEWTYSSVGAECSFLGKAGYKYVQVSPASEHIQGGQWWTSYQKVSNKIQSKHGSKEDFRNMVNMCNAAGVKVMVDLIWNHMTGFDEGYGVAGTHFTHYAYDGLYSGWDFHYCGTSGNGIQDWNDAWQVRNCELVRLADLKTESPYVRQTNIDHANELLGLGAAGFRLDAAKHMPLDDVQYMLGKLSFWPYVTSEVIGMANPAPSEYAQVGATTVSDYYQKMARAFWNGNLAGLNGIENGFNVGSDSATVYIASHDSERGGVGDSLSQWSGNNQYILSSVFMLAYPYGTPTVLSSYKYSNKDDGPPNGGYGTCSGSGGAGSFNCEHRWPAIAGMVGFRSACDGQSLQNWQTAGNDRIAFSRGAAGFVAINSNGGDWSQTLNTGMPAGNYCDIITGGKVNGQCVGTTVTVKNGQASVKVPSRGAIAISAATKI